MIRPTLDELAIKYSCDKSSLHHDYCKIYERYFSELRDSNINFLELGYGGYEYPDKGGESASMWREYFTKARITILEIHKKNNTIKGVNVEQGRQEDRVKCFAIQHRVKTGLEIIIDDASHLSSLTIQSFENYYSSLNSGGYYVIEDLHSSYDEYYGEKESDPNPNTTIKTAMQFLKSLCDQVNKDFIGTSYKSDYDIEFIHFYKDLVIIKKK